MLYSYLIVYDEIDYSNEWWEIDRSEWSGSKCKCRCRCRCRSSIDGGWYGSGVKGIKVISVFVFSNKVRRVTIFLGKVMETSDDILVWRVDVDKIIGICFVS